MRLLIDVGNSQVKYVLQGATQQAPLSAVTYIDYQAFLTQLAQGKFCHVQEVIFANVHDQAIDDSIMQWGKANQVAIRQVHSTATAFGVTSCYQTAERLGVDRWLAMIGAKQRYPENNLLIIDAGTAMTIDLLAANGQHLGGWIMPGVQTLFNGLLARTHKINASANTSPSLSFGKNSSDCLNNGNWAMTIGAIKEAIVESKRLLSLDKILITGGNGANIAKLLTDACQLEPKLIFHGLSCFQASLLVNKAKKNSNNE
ncbi:type III pantothenate kinase [Colwellia chukchiensis]|uniref:Type III pantothenate kinase n=1 Tax=Colwellia chukchiensis TaxID=641665 RepID=A0A1H7PQH9_9GAMM|nr:type III pantothenate kinase [Colwellia chukchiensis]SEL38033.1 type III pantothenate kinase [Colwellia chukchiensis]